MTEPSTATLREFTITRVFDVATRAGLQGVDRARPVHALVGPRGFTAPLSEISQDPGPGGKWRATMISDADGSEITFFGVYRDVVEPERLVFTIVDPEDPDLEARREQGLEDEVVTLTFTDLGGTTEMVLHQAGYLPEDEIARAKEGWSSFFDCLADHLATG